MPVTNTLLQEHRRIKYETLLEIITARDVRRAYAFRKQTAEEGAYFDELFTGIDKTSRKRDFGGTLVRTNRAFNGMMEQEKTGLCNLKNGTGQDFFEGYGTGHDRISC